MKYESNEPSICPCCNSEKLDYGSIELEDNLCYFPFECKDCKTEGKEYYSMIFAGHSIFENGEVIEVKID